MDCMKITGLRSNEVAGLIFRMTQSKWMASSLDTTIPNGEKEDVVEGLDVTEWAAEDVGAMWRLWMV